MFTRKLAFPYYLFLLIFILVPLGLVLFFAVTTPDGGVTLTNFERFFTSQYLGILGDSLRIAFLSTLICLLIGYPIAYIIANMKGRARNTMLLLMVIPMWMNFLLRTYAWMTILSRNGLFNQFLALFGHEGFDILFTETAVLLGMVYNFLPFMVLPIYSILVKMDKNVIEAARDLGADSKTVFRKVIFPLSLPGVLSGIMMVFIPAISTFEISLLLGGNKFNLIGNLIEQQFKVTGDWHFGSAMSTILMVIMIVVMIVSNRVEGSREQGGLL